MTIEQAEALAESLDLPDGAVEQFIQEMTRGPYFWPKAGDPC